MALALDPLPIPDAHVPERRVTVDCIDDSQAFSALQHEWRELLQASASDNPFLTWEWLRAWWTRFGSPGSLRLIVVRAGGTLVAIAPFHLVTSPLAVFSHLEFLGTGDAGSDYLDVIVRRGSEGEAVRSLADALTAQKLALRLTHLPPASLAAELARCLAGRGWAASSADDGTCPIVPLGGHTFDSFLGTLGASHRANVRRRLRALHQRFDVRFERITDDDRRQDMLTALSGFHDRRYQERGGSTAFSTPDIRAFHDDATRSASDCGWLRMYALSLDGDVAAVMYGFNYGGRFYFYQHGFNEQYASHSVGLALMALTIGAAIDEGAVDFDMLWGTEAYKSLWARDARMLERVELFPVGLNEAVHRHAVEARRGVARFARRVLSRGFPGVARVS